MNVFCIRSLLIGVGFSVFSVLPAPLHAQQKVIPNRLIDYSGFLNDAGEVAKLRQQRRVTEAEFIRMATDPATIVFDARTDQKYQLLHIRGAKHLPLPDITEAELARVIPSRINRVLIYCNNNFENEPAAFPAKAMRASLNIYTFNTLYSYGYTNVYELGPLIDIKRTSIPFEGTRSTRQQAVVGKPTRP
jgi:rhodanese-related sulfurtransferase